MAATFWLYSHNFTHSGAPLALAAIARELADSGWRKQLRLISWGGLHDRRHSSLHKELLNEGIICDVLEPSQPPPRLHKGDRLLLNSLALPEHVIEQALAWLDQHKLSCLYWYAHESRPELFLLQKDWPKRLNQLLRNGCLQLRVPSLHSLNTYRQWLDFDGNSLAVQNPILRIPPHLNRKSSNDFSEIKLQLTGAVGTGQKGHLWLVQLLEIVLEQAPLATPGLRPLSLQFIGIETGVYAALARDVCRQASELLGDKFSWVEQGGRDQTLAFMAQSNFAVSCSSAETFSLVSLEAMALGQPILRNQTGGWHEQLTDEKNGFDLGPPSPLVTPSQVALIQRMRDPSLISQSKFELMSKCSVIHSKELMSQSMTSWLE